MLNGVPVIQPQPVIQPRLANLSGTGKRRRNETEVLDDDSVIEVQGGTSAEGAEREIKRQKKLKEFEPRGIKLGNNNSRVGNTRINKFTFDLEYNLNGKWELAAYHYERRSKLLQIENAKGQYSKSCSLTPFLIDFANRD